MKSVSGSQPQAIFFRGARDLAGGLSRWRKPWPPNQTRRCGSEWSVVVSARHFQWHLHPNCKGGGGLRHFGRTGCRRFQRYTTAIKNLQEFS